MQMQSPAAVLLGTFRTTDGSGNNVTNPQLSPVASSSDELRIAAANFLPGTADTPIDGPNAREISNVVSSGPGAELTDPGGASAMMYVWGQFIDHNLDLEAVGSTPINISIPAND